MTQIILHGGYRGDWEQGGDDVALFSKLVAAAEKADGRVLISFLAQETPEHFPHLQALKDCFKQLTQALRWWWQAHTTLPNCCHNTKCCLYKAATRPNNKSA